MIDIDASREASALKVYHKFWDSYIKGNIPIFSSTLDEDFEMIGTSETEVCHNKAEGIAFFKNQIEEIVGKAEMRNRNIITKAIGEMFLIIENCDIYVISEPEWTFYSKLRISTLLHETPLGWKVLHQHGSLPDMKVEDGETMALEKVSQENLELRQAVKRRTTELENKTKELEIEAALERVRAVAMSMKKPDDMLDVCQIIADQLKAFGVEQIRNVQTAIIDEEKGHYLCYQHFPAYEKAVVELTEYFKSPVEHEMVRQMLASKDGHFIGSIQGKELREFAAHRKEENHFSDPLLDQSQELSYCFLSIGKGGLGLSLYQALNQEVLHIFKRFHQVFTLAYRRFLDIQQAEEQAREAKIEAALERVRSKSLAMHQTSELQSVIHTVHEELLRLNLSIFGGSFIVINSELDTELKCWGAGGTAETSEEIHIPRYDKPFYTNLLERVKKGPSFFTEEFTFEEKVEFFTFLFNHQPWSSLSKKEKKQTLETTGGYTRSCVVSEHTSIFIINHEGVPFSEADNAILKRFGRVFEQSYTRFLDLKKAEEQAREARIESALERVRSRSLAMHHSSELSSVVDALLQEFTGLDFTLTFCIINLIDGDDLSNTVWAANPETGKDAESYYMKFEDYDFHRAMWNAWKAQDKRFVYVLEGEEKKIYDEYLYSETEFKRFPKHVQEANKSLERYVAGFTFFKYSGLQTVSVNPISEEELAILERFGKVFEQAYIRFLDLQKAEAQAREAQIETALEKVRSRSMGMQKSDELADLSLELVKQVQALGVETWFCAFNIYDENGEESIEWGSNGQSTFPRYKTPRENVFLDYYKAGQRGETLLINEISEEECPSHYEYLCSLPGVGDQLLKMKAAGISFPKYQIDHVAFFKYGYILFITYEPVPESHSVFKRFAQVFEQTYTRFLDLQRAEAQTRKSEIEVAVERVRAQSMAMHHPDDLDKVNKELLSQLQWLQIQGLSGVTFYLVEENGWVKAWDFSSPGNIGNQTSYTFQFDSNKHEMLGFPFKILVNTDLDYFIADYPLEKLKKALPELEEIDPAVAEIFTNAIETGALSHQWSACARISSGMLGVDLTAPPSEDTKTIVLKMAGAFNQAYTRFLDLQKAEAQAREAQIESALERVRSRSMAMHNSNEIGDVAMILFQQLKSLGGELWGTGFGFCEKDSAVDEFWFANENGIMPHLKIPNNVDPAHKQMYEGWKKNLDFLSIENGGKELRNHYKYMLTVPDVQPIFQGILDQGIEFPTWQKWHAAYFKYGYMLVITTETYEDEKVFTRFARVFEQAYTRFLDLQKAEAQAREARIEAALERTRTQSMLMKHSDEIKSISTIFHQQLLELDIPSEFSYVWLPDEPNSEHQFWASWSEEENGKAIYLSKQVTYPLDKSEPYTKACFEAWAQPEVLLEEFISPPEVAGFFEVWQELLEGAEKLKAEYFPEGIFYSEAYMRFGCFGINIRRRLTPEEKSILKRFSIEFERAYTRFLDLKKAEEQAREAQIELAVERVRARALAMYQSGEILEVVHKLKEEIMSLNIPQVAAATIHLKESNGRCRVWDLTSLELKEEDLHLPLDVSFRLDDTHPDFFMRKIWAHTEGYFVVIQKKRDFPHTVQWLKDNGHPEQAEEARIFFDTTQLEQAYHPTVPLKNGRMSLDLLEPPQDEVASILKKMAAAFDLAYKRFEDLQKAEAQAKEAQIELSLERIRSKVTSMQESTDLLDIMVSIRSEFVSLGHEAQYFWYMRWLPSKYEKAMTSGDGTQVGMVMSLPRHIHGDIPLVADWERGNEPTLIFPMDVDTAMDYVQKMVSLGDFEKVDPNAPTMDDIRHIGGLTFIMAKTSQGEIGYSLPGYVPNPPEEAVSTLARFAGVFDLAYKRFEDLKKAEKDLIAIKAAKSKAESALKELKAAQEQLVQQEKLASLGQLTAGIAHEIKNPLNFVNNFSELSKELIEEVFEELEKLDESDIKQEIMDILTDVQSNLTKVHEHGSRADGIVKSMLQHSRGSAGKTSAIRVNEFVKEFSNLAFHGMRAGKNPINVNLDFDLDENAGEVTLVMEDFSRVILNIANNAFDAMHDKQNSSKNGEYLPSLKIKTKRLKNKVLISIQDNGPGIPEDIKDKILQPFFTTKKGTDGTGLGLSITHDIVKAHGGEIKIESKPGDGASFLISLPIS
ncbi:ATP-binding protein [Algoriphagus algorifonticola]|uniref:ATP-binding protein n=1 Tax=Algoriphagus algorifonticola TaxID=2593007 RepID=UPI0011AB1902|nr:ATP-binding protein [Algoriphagus algorifonticola]